MATLSSLGKIKSPNCNSFFLTSFPSSICPFFVVLKLIPKCLYIYDTNPKQSNPFFGVVPSETCGTPKNVFA